MAKLYYYYGAMGSSKTANALMTHFNYEEVGQKALLCKPAIDARDGERTVYSRIGLQHDCILLEELQQMKEEEIRGYDCIIVDEVQFATPQQVDFLSDIGCAGGLLWTARRFPQPAVPGERAPDCDCGCDPGVKDGVLVRQKSYL